LGGIGGSEVDIEALKIARDLVSHMSQSPIPYLKHAAAQRRVSPEGVALAFIQDVKNMMVVYLYEDTNHVGF